METQAAGYLEMHLAALSEALLVMSLALVWAADSVATKDNLLEPSMVAKSESAEVEWLVHLMAGMMAD